MGDAESIHGDPTRRVSVETSKMDWTLSPSGTVWRKRVHRVGPAESGQVTSVVRYEPNSEFPAHDHPEGEEILVLDGVFSDEHGDWAAGTYLLNPEGFRHAPFSKPGCQLFVKLRQFPGSDRRHVVLQTFDLERQPTERAGVWRKPLYEQPGYEDTMRLERWESGARVGELHYPGGAELFVLDGDFTDEHGTYGGGAWLRFPMNSRHQPQTEIGCTLYVKEGGLGLLRSSA